MAKKPQKSKNDMSQQDMQREATKIVNLGKNAIRDVNKYTWNVLSNSSPDTWYTVKMSKKGLKCTCVYYQKRKTICAHSMAVGISILQRAFEMESGDKKIVINENIPIQCPNGHTDKINRDGKRNRIHHNPAQRYVCCTCGTRFTGDVIGFADMYYPPKAVLLTLSLFAIDNSPESIVHVLEQNMNIVIHETSIQR